MAQLLDSEILSHEENLRIDKDRLIRLGKRREAVAARSIRTAIQAQDLTKP